MKQKWGQHFLVRERYVHRMIKEAQIQEGDCVLEIGPGRGVLTRHLLEHGAKVTAIEIDPNLYQHLLQKFETPSFHLLNQDILSIPPDQLEQFYATPFKVVANLPYNVGTPIMMKLMEIKHQISSVTVMLQKEVAERICATPEDKKKYGYLSIAMDLHCSRKKLFDVPPEAFSPPPKVDSAVIQLIPQKSEWDKDAQFLEWIKPLFQQRRKTLMNSLFRAYPQETLRLEEEQKVWIGNRRPEQLSTQEWKILFLLLTQN
ncbi:MAG: ribosomal RNA small subunit methyltransferase A [SAR324 cluster bacterium]|nr:ribosomal RNA small subunit methyltransferase A [SAR324 cluster bacterium]